MSTKISDIKSELSSALSSIDSLDAGTIIIKVQKSISSKIEDALTNLTDYIKTKTNGLIDNLSSKIATTADGYIDMAADKVLDVTNEFLDNTFDSVANKLPDIAGKKSNGSPLASILKFNYGDYLKIFVFLKLCVDDTGVMSRVADVIQLNINNALTDSGYSHPVKSKGKTFLMSEAYTYVEISADVKLKTLFISLPFFTNYSDKSGNYFSIHYKSVQGY